MSTRVAIVTGGAQGIGKAIALRLASDGLDIAVADIESKTAALDEVVAEIQNLGRRGISVACDVAQEDNVKALVERTVSELGSVDVMIANAGITQKPRASIAEADFSTWENVFRVNLYGTMYCYKYAAQQMIKQGRGGRIIGASSICGKRGFSMTGAYNISKAAIISLTQTASLELASHKITVNAYAPGAVQTPMTVTPFDGGRPCGALVKAFGMPDAPVGQPEDIAQAISFLASPKSEFVTGQTLSLNGGIFFD